MTSGGASHKPSVLGTGTVLLCARPDSSRPFKRGDANADGMKDISDVIAILGFLYLGLPGRLHCEKSADADGSAVLDLSDGIYLINNLFLGGPVPLPPYPACGVDDTPDRLPCESYAPCAGP